MRRLVAVLAVVVLGVFLLYRQRQPVSTPAAPVAQAGAPAAAPVSHASFDPTTHVAVVHTKDFAFDAPDSITAGWTTFRLTNDGPNLHHIQLVRLDSGKTAAQLVDAMKNPGPPPRWAAFVGGPNAPNPGATIDGTFNLQPGHYALICLVDIPDNIPHFTKGMAHDLTVTAGTGAPSTEPTADETISLADYAFTAKTALKAGQHTIKVVNSGPQPHEVEIFRFAPGKTMKDLNAWTAKPVGPPPGDAIGGASVLMPGMSGYFSVNMTPGHYLMMCFVPDAKDGKAHIDHGMMKEFTIN